MNQELIRIVDNIARDKNIDKESLFVDLEEAMVSAVRKHFGEPESNIIVNIDRATGQVTASKDDEQIDIRQLGRIPAQTAKQVMIQKIRADERDSIYAEFVQRKGEIISGSVVRYEGGTLTVNLSHWAEGFMPKGEQIMGQSHRPGERIRCLILDVKETSNQVKIILSRTHPDFIRRLFELEVPEIAENIIEIRALAREAGYRTKVAVASLDEKVDPVGACVGVRGSRIKNIVDELGGEKIDIVRWNESSQVLVANALMPAKVSEIALCFELGKATVVVDEDQLSLAIGKHGQNVRLAARLTGWDIDILMPEEYNQGIERLTSCIKNVEAADDMIVDKLIALGVISVLDLDDVGTEPLINELNIDSETAEQMVEAANEEAKRLAAESKQEQAEKEPDQQTNEEDDQQEPADKE
ncbi:MAG: transcription termination factor NusA [Phycisphaerae bacterium]|nr:transcription termination factor NusA [Phycisphaerae bacterium]NIP54078.1 transcription termination factor NusA [Phycisphaerae bacterium]NIS53006.1 transcription termination factor NusA [Phycisphaerae bacterium]NIU10488.1 transcription termination factor NusA [Phycisphaerae bacterium]NIU58276.1 transcription termination factor NusA [Phycisphaerae bacterium]